MRTKIRKSISLLLAAALTFMTMTDGTAAQAAKKSQKANAKVSSVKITNVKKKLRLQKGKRFKLKTSVKVKPNKSKYKKLKFTSSNRKVVLVNSRGLLKGMRVGTAKITAASKTNARKKATISVSVTKDVLVSGIRLNKTKITADEFNEEEIQLEVKKILPANAKNKEVEWSTSDDDVADVDDDGVVTTGDVGTAVITATAADKGGATATCKVIVKENTEVPDDDDTSDGDANNGNGNPAVVPTPPAGVVTPAPVPGDTTSPSPDASAGVATPTPVPDGKKTPSPSALPSKIPTTDNQVFGVSDPYRITISEENEAYATSVSKRLANGMSEEDAASRNKDPEFHTDGSVTFTSTDQYNSGMCFYIDPDVKTSMDRNGTITYTAKKVDLTKYEKVRITVKDAYLETSLKVLTDGSIWWSKAEKWEGSDNIVNGERVIEYSLDEGGTFTWEQLKEAEAVGLGWHNANGETATIVSIELVGKRDAVTPTEKPEASEEPSEETKNPQDVAALQKIITEQRALGAAVSEDLNSAEYEWSIGRLTGIHWENRNLSGTISFSGLSKLKILACSQNALVSIDVSKNLNLERLYCCDNQLNSLDVSKNEQLLSLICSRNQLKTLKMGNNQVLNWLDCYNNQLSNLDVSKCVKLDVLYCYQNELNKLDVSNNKVLNWLVCDSNQLESLDVSNNTGLTRLFCSRNQLGSLDVSNNTGLTSLQCGYNQIKELDVSECVELVYLECEVNELHNLDVSQNTKLETLECYENLLKTLDVSQNEKLTNLWCDSAVEVIGYKAVEPTEPPAPEKSAAPAPSATKNPGDVAVLQKIISEQRALGATVSEDLNSAEYGWNEDGRLAEIIWGEWENGKGGTGRNLSGTVSFAGLDKLRYLYCSYNELDSINVSENTNLSQFYCEENQLTNLDVSNNLKLNDFWCSKNELTGLDVSNNTELSQLYCYDNNLEILDLSKNTRLFDLLCGENQLSSLDTGGSTQLYRVECAGNNLTHLDVSRNTGLEELTCSGNQLSELNISKNTELRWLSCSNNRLENLDVSKNTRLSGCLECANNQLSSLDVSKNIKLRVLSCFGNQLDALDVSKNEVLTHLDCADNQITTLDVTNNPQLSNLTCDDTVDVIGYDK